MSASAIVLTRRGFIRSDGDRKANDAEEGLIHERVSVVTHNKTAEALQPGKRAFDLPTLAVPSRSTSILGVGGGKTCVCFCSLDRPA